METRRTFLSVSPKGVRLVCVRHNPASPLASGGSAKGSQSPILATVRSVMIGLYQKCSVPDIWNPLKPAEPTPLRMARACSTSILLPSMSRTVIPMGSSRLSNSLIASANVGATTKSAFVYNVTLAIESVRRITPRQALFRRTATVGSATINLTARAEHRAPLWSKWAPEQIKQRAVSFNLGSLARRLITRHHDRVVLRHLPFPLGGCNRVYRDDKQAQVRFLDHSQICACGGQLATPNFATFPSRVALKTTAQSGYAPLSGKPVAALSKRWKPGCRSGSSTTSCSLSASGRLC